MNILFQTILSMSASGVLLIVGVALMNRLLRTKCSRRWQYYIWLLVIARLLLPFEPRESLMARISPAVKQAVVESGVFSGLEKQESAYADISEEKDAAVSSGQEEDATADSVQETMEEIAPAQGESVAVDALRGELVAASAIQGRESDGLMQSGMVPAKSHIGMIWFIIALGMLMRKIIMYRSFIKHVMAGKESVSDCSLLNTLYEVQWQTGVGKEVELFVNPRISSPMLIGVCRPCIILPDTDISGKDFRYIVTHELMHHKRRDILYKWLVQFVVCLHWFNPLVYVMSREISKACELSCDEAVLAKLGYEHAADYGKTLLDAMAAAWRYKEPLTTVSLNANKRILRERLGAIMNDNRKSGKIRMITAGLTVSMVLGAFFVGIYPANAAEASESSAAGVSGKPAEEKSDDLEKALDEKLTEEYRAAGITKSGKNYYYKDQLVHIFLDIHKPDQRFYTLNMNPAGTVNVKILREEDGKIIGAAYMTDSEVTELLGDMDEGDMSEGEPGKEKAGNKSEEDFPRTMIVKDHVCKIRDGAGVEFKVVGLVAEGEELTVLGSEEDSNGQLWYRLDKESLEEKPDPSVEACYIRADLLWEDD